MFTHEKINHGEAQIFFMWNTCTPLVEIEKSSGFKIFHLSPLYAIRMFRFILSLYPNVTLSSSL